MCLITYKPADATLDLKRMQAAFSANSDGWGIMVHAPGNFLVQKIANPHLNGEKAAFEQFVAAYEAHREFPMGVHFRSRTHGAVDSDNTHPYEILSTSKGDSTDLWLMHNGILKGWGSNTYQGKSDTAEFIDNVLTPLFRKFNGLWTEDALHYIVGEAIGSGNKLLIMGPSLENPVFINKKSGTVDGKLWYSNSYSFYKEKTSVVYVNGGGSKSEAPFCPVPSSDASSALSSVKRESFSSKSAPTIFDFTNIKNFTFEEIRDLYLSGNSDPRISGNTIPFAALDYLNEEDIEAIVDHNPAAIVDFIMRLKESFTISKPKDDREFREAVFLSS